MTAESILDKHFIYRLSGNIHEWYDDEINGYIFRELAEKEGGYTKEKAKEYVVKNLQREISNTNYFKKYKHSQ